MIRDLRVAGSVMALAILAPAAHGQDGSSFRDSFETDRGWTMFEEIVGGNACYGDGVGEASPVAGLARTGVRSLRVWSNKAGSNKSNHVIAARKVAAAGREGVWRYRAFAYIAPETASTGQVGPELSMQDTRQVAPGEFRTSIAGLQYWASPYLPHAWVIWREEAPGQAGWHTFMTQPLQAGQWYEITLDADFTKDRYLAFSLRGGGVEAVVDLSSFAIAREARFTEEAFWVTLESENLWSNCGEAGAFDYKVSYDDVQLTPGGR